MPELNQTLRLEGSGLLSVTGINPATETATLGSLDLLPVDLSLGSGTGDEQANQWHLAEYTLNATTGQNLDLQALTNRLGAVVLDKVRNLLVVVDEADGTKVVRVGPQNQSNAWQGPFAVVDADGWLEVRDALVLGCRFGNGIGAVDATHKVLRIYNPGASPVTVQVWIVGVDS